ncbi:MAG: DUF6688 family protein [Chloroflexota bacterium]
MIETPKRRLPKDWGKRLVVILSFTVLPLISFSLAADQTLFVPEWQTDNFTDYVSLLFIDDVTTVFGPFLFYAALAMLLITVAPTYFMPIFLVRFGVYTATILSLHYVIQLSIVTNFMTFPVAIITGVVFWTVPWLFRWLVHKISLRKVWLGIIAILVFWLGPILIISIPLMIPSPGDFDPPDILFDWVIGPFYFSITVVLMGLFLNGPFICLWLAGSTSIALWRRYDDPRQRATWFWPSAISWLIAYGISWQVAVTRAMAYYNKLPTSPPADCYIATAAAQGHIDFVKAKLILTEDGQWMQVNEQLQVLKAAELCLKVTTPRIHLLLRAVYDVVGQRLAQCLVNPIIADAAYLLLKPAELAAKGLMLILIPGAKAYIAQIYR